MKKGVVMNSNPKTCLDQMVESEQGQLLKAALPYLPHAVRQSVSIYAKANELLNTIALFTSDTGNQQMQAASVCHTDPLDMLNDIRRYCSGNSRKQLDRINDLMAMAELISLMNMDMPKED